MAARSASSKALRQCDQGLRRERAAARTPGEHAALGGGRDTARGAQAAVALVTWRRSRGRDASERPRQLTADNAAAPPGAVSCSICRVAALSAMQLGGTARGGCVAAPRASRPRSKPPAQRSAPRRPRGALPVVAAAPSWEDEAWDATPTRPRAARDEPERWGGASNADTAAMPPPPERGLGRRRGGLAAAAAAAASARAADAQAAEEAAWERRLEAVEGERTKTAQERLMRRSAQVSPYFYTLTSATRVCTGS